MVNIERVRKEFPFLKKGFIYFDSAATSLKPQSVINKEVEYYQELGVNINRGTSSHNFNTTESVEEVRTRISDYIGSQTRKSIIFTSNTTTSINLVAKSFVDKLAHKKANIVISQLEHHSNYAPWIELAKLKGIECRIVKLTENRLDINNIKHCIDDNTILTAITGMSNLTGQVLNIKELSKHCKKKNSRILVDGAQLIAHSRVNVQELDIDFFCFSSHKLYGTFGLGVLYVKESLLNKMEPVTFGGNMITYITNDDTIHYKDAPYKFESGTQNAPAIYSLGGVLDFLDKYSIEEKEKYTSNLGKYLVCELDKIKDIQIYSVSGSIVTFNINGIHPHDASEFLDKKGIIVRTGNLCASPFFMNRIESGVIRVSLDIFNTKEELDKLVETIKEIKDFFNEFI